MFIHRFWCLFFMCVLCGVLLKKTTTKIVWKPIEIENEKQIRANLMHLIEWIGWQCQSNDLYDIYHSNFIFIVEREQKQPGEEYKQQWREKKNTYHVSFCINYKEQLIKIKENQQPIACVFLRVLFLTMPNDLESIHSKYTHASLETEK